jgi:hypothetical protein
MEHLEREEEEEERRKDQKARMNQQKLRQDMDKPPSPLPFQSYYIAINPPTHPLNRKSTIDTTSLPSYLPVLDDKYKKKCMISLIFFAMFAYADYFI